MASTAIQFYESENYLNNLYKLSIESLAHAGMYI